MGRNRQGSKMRHRRDRVAGAGADDQGDLQAVPSGGKRNYCLAPKESKAFEQYYKGQGIVPEEEFDNFIHTLQQPLPSTFRITGFTSHAAEMLRITKSDYLKDLVNVEIDGRVIQPTKCLPWYPDELAWQLDLERKLIRQNDSLKRLHKFLVQETESGNISRQESVSMIPPLVLDIEPHHKVLDMCAAPGSKTAQLIEMLHAKEASDGPPHGFVMANDSDNKRCYLMVHQIGRLASPNFVVVNMDASNFPNLYLQDSAGRREQVKFDRILCDVPCSGDGTLRKNVDAWYRWNPNVGHGLHNLQIRILRRGLDVLATGGRLVYSTCSFNPVENEAVLTTVLRLMKVFRKLSHYRPDIPVSLAQAGSVELIDVSDRLPGLIREPGRLSWRIMAKTGEWYDKYEDVPERLHTQIAPTSFPPPLDEAQTLGLDKCIRVLPHKQNTGGFFVAVLRRICPTPSREQLTKTTDKTGTTTVSDDSSTAESKELNQETGVNDDAASGTKRKPDESLENEIDSRGGPYRKKARHWGFKEDPFIFLKQDDKLWIPVREFFGLKDCFPFDQLMVRCETGKKRNIYFVASTIKSLVQLNEDRFKFINLGVKIMSRSMSKEVDCEFRLVQDGLHLLYPYITKRIVNFKKDDVVTLLSSENPYISRMSKTTQEQLNNIGQGGCVFIYEPVASEAGPQCRLLLCGWKGKVSCRSFLPKNDRGHSLRLCGVELKDRDEKEVAAKSADHQTKSPSSSEMNDDEIDGDHDILEEGENANGKEDVDNIEAKDCVGTNQKPDTNDDSSIPLTGENLQ